MGLTSTSRSRWLLAFAVVLPAAVQAWSQTPVEVVGVQYWTLNESTRVAVEVSGPFQFTPSRISNPERVFFDVAQSRPAIRGAIGVGVHFVQVGDARLRQIRIAQPQGGTTRIVLDLPNDKVIYRASQLTGPDRLMIELFDPTRTGPELTPSVTVSRRFVEGPRRASSVAPQLALPNDMPPPVTAPLERLPSSVLESTLGRRPVFASKEPPRPFAGVQAKTVARPRLVWLSEVPPRFTPAAPTPPGSVLLTMVPRAGRYRGGATVPAVRLPVQTAAVTSGNNTVLVPAMPNTAARSSTGGRRGRATAEQPVEQSLTRLLGLKLNRVVIDAGHGGKDVGTIGVTGLYEKDVVLDVALKVGALIEKRLGAEVVYTRNDDTFIQLEDRPRIANERKADLFLSIHANSSSYESVAGVETYYLSMTASNRAAEEVVARENAVSEKSIFELQDLVRKIALNDKVKESSEFAARLQASMVAGVHGGSRTRNRGVRRAPFAVLIGARMPAVLVEIGFVTNEAEEEKLRKPEHRQKIAESIFEGVKKYGMSLSHAAPGELVTKQGGPVLGTPALQ